MTEATLRRILAVMALVGAGYAVVVLAGGSGEPDRAEGPVPEALRRAAAGELDSVRVEGDDTVVVRRRDGVWRVNGHRADSTDVAGLREALGDADGLELASRNAANHARLGVDSAGARRLVLGVADGDPVVLLAGDRGPYRSSVYLRVPGTTPVHLARGELGDAVRRGPDAWRDRSLVAVDTGRVDVARVRRGDTVYRLRRSGDGWTVDGGPADSARVRRLLGDLAGLDADGFLPDTVAVEPADRSLTVLAAAGDTLARLRMRRAGPERTPHYRVAVRGRRGVFELRPPKADRLAPPRARLRAGRPAAGDSAAPPAPGRR